MSETKQLLDMLRDANPAVRRFALQRLGEAGDRAAIADLRRATEDEDPGVAGQAEKSLYFLLQQSTVGPEPRERVVSFPGAVTGQVADVFEVEPLQATGRLLLRAHSQRIARELAGQSASMARACAAALGKIRDPEFIPQLALGLTYEDRRHECAYALAAFRDPNALAPLMALLDGPDRQGLRLAVYALGPTRLPEVTRKLLGLLLHPDAEVRTDVVFALGESGDPGIGRKLAYLLDDKDDHVVIRTLTALRKLEYPELSDAILSRLPSARNDRLRATLIGTLIGLRPEARMIAALERSLHDPDARVRANAVEAIGSLALPKDQRLGLLRQASEDRNNRVLGNLAVAMGDVDTVASLKLLSAMLNSPDKWERASAVYAAGFIPEQRVGLWLANIFMFEEDVDVLRNTVTSLSRFRGQAISEQLTKALRHHNPMVRSGSARVLGALADRVGREALLKALDVENDPIVKADLLGALAKLCDTSHIGPIAIALRDSHPRVQARALEALEQIGSVEILPHVEPYLSSLDPRVKANAARALWKLGHLDVVAVLGGMLHSSSPDEVMSAIYALGELGDALEYLSDLRHFYLLASALRTRSREAGAATEAGVSLPSSSPAVRILSDLLDAEYALRHIYAGRYPEAINTLQGLLQTSPGSVSANFLVGDLYRRLENTEMAMKRFDACRPSDGPFVNLDLHKASVSATLSDTRGSILHYLDALRSKLETIGRVADMATELIGQDRIGDASLVLKSLVQQVPIDSKLHYKVGVQMLNGGYYEEALGHLFKALLADPKDARVILQLATLMARLDQRIVLRKLFEWVIELVGPDDPIAREVALLARPDETAAVESDASLAPSDPTFEA